MAWRLPMLVVLVLACSLATPSVLAQQLTLTVELVDEGCPDPKDHFCILPSVLTVEAGKDLELRVTNTGRVDHNLSFAPGTPEVLARHGIDEPIAANGSAVILIPWAHIEEALGEADTGSFELHCGIPGHATLGQRATLQVGDPDAEPRPQPFPGMAVLLAVLAIGAWLRRR